MAQEILIHQKLAKIFVLSDMLIQEIDDPLMKPTRQTKTIQDKSRELQELLIPVIDKFYESSAVSKTTFFLRLQDKFNYIFEREFKTKNNIKRQLLR